MATRGVSLTQSAKRSPFSLARTLGVLGLMLVGGTAHAADDAFVALLESAKQALGAAASVVWPYVCSLLGLDPSLSAGEAIKKKIQALWAKVSGPLAALKSLYDGFMRCLNATFKGRANTIDRQLFDTNWV